MIELGIVGALTMDHIVQVGVEPRFNMLGGPGLYSSCAAHLVPGVRIRLSTEMPRKSASFEAALTGREIDLRHAGKGYGAFECWILNSDRGRRVVSAEPLETETAEVDEPMNPARVPPSFFAGLDGLLWCAPQEMRHQDLLPPLVAADPDQRSVAHFGWDYWKELAMRTQVLLPSRIHLRAMDPDPRRAVRLLAQTLRVTVVGRLDAEGVYLVEADGREWQITDDTVTVVDTTGAGDAMAGATVAALAVGYPAPDAAAYGVSAARLVLSDWGYLGLAHAAPLTAPLDGVAIVAGGGR